MTTDRQHPMRAPPPPHAVTAAHRDALFAAIRVHDDIRLDATLPTRLRLDYDRDSIARCFALSQALWDAGSDRRALARIATALAWGRSLGADDQHDYKMVRARFKQLRFAWVVCDARHDYPRALHTITRTMGRLQDALKNSHRRTAAGHAAMLRVLSMRGPYALLEHAPRHFHACDDASLRGWIRHELDRIRALLAEPEVTARTFHEARKVVSRLVAFYDCVDTLFPSDHHRRIVQFLGTINGLMGGMHDVLIERKLSGAQDYRAGRFVLPDGIAIRLRTLERTFAAAGQAAGGA